MPLVIKPMAFFSTTGIVGCHSVLQNTRHVTINNPLSFTVSALDNDSDELVYKSLGLPEGAEFSGQTFTWTIEQTGTYFVTFVVRDYKSLDYLTVQIIVEEQ